ncbi:MAG: M64 family metallopeptidase [Bacteroidota bacterium]
MKKISLLFISLFILFEVTAQQFLLDTLFFNGQSEKRINYVILGDGYLEAQLASFRQDAEQFANDLFNTSPYKEYKNYFNVFAISVSSNEKGAAVNPDNLIDNYFGSTFNFAGIERLLVPTRGDKVIEVLANNFPLYDQVIMLVNSPKYGGSGGWVATASTNAASSEIAIHELGHSFANLSDEYWAGEQFANETANMTQESSTDLVKWKNWMNDLGISIIPHTGNSTWHKPHNNCKMQFLNNPFCAVCREQFIRTTQQLISAIDQYTPINTEKSDDPITFSISLIVPVPNTLKVIWLLDDKKIGENVISLDLDQSLLSGESHILKASVYDSTLFDRKDSVYINTVVWNIDTTISSSIEQKLENRKQLGIITNVENVISDINLNAFPNPLSNKVTIEYELKNKTHTELLIFNSEGKLTHKFLEEQQYPGTYHYEVETANYSSGLYFLVFKSDNFYKTIKMMKVD